MTYFACYSEGLSTPADIVMAWSVSCVETEIAVVYRSLLTLGRTGSDMTLQVSVLRPALHAELRR